MVHFIINEVGSGGKSLRSAVVLRQRMRVEYDPSLSDVDSRPDVGAKVRCI